MKLLKLSSNNSKFKTLKFESGLNILAGLQLTSADKKTYNGVGKSFSLNLIHLMLGSYLDPTKPTEKKIQNFLSGYGVFYLEFEHEGKPYKVEKDFGQSHHILNGEKIVKSNYPSELKKIFIKNELYNGVSFKQILNVFARRYGGTYYSSIIAQQGRPEQDYHQMYTNLALLGINTNLVTKKSIVKEKLNKLKKAKSVIENYESLLGESNINDLKDELKTLIKNKQDFVIAENYDKYKREADAKTEIINKIRNEIYEVIKSMGRKKQSLDEAGVKEIDLVKVKKIYEEASFFFGDKISIRLDQATDFHKNLLKNRASRINSEILELEDQLNTLNVNLKDNERIRDSILKDLDSKGALEEYNSINERIRSFESEIGELDKYRQILQSFKEDKSQYDLENANIKAEAVKYLVDSKIFLETIENMFRALVKKFYLNHGGSLEISETNDAKYLFNIDAQIPRDGSQGINEVKIFCYDLLLYQLNPSLLSFIAHDGCIFSEMDPRQKSMIFKVIIEIIKSSELQYFVNLGQSTLDEILDKDNKLNILNKEEKQYIQNNVILELYDKDPINWLFGEAFG
ncbi:DUF2326 domain-containing protein [Marinicellulosiphila megalodicopiae]|uniref:DUF2326 domain-containing protein n=1 Tax=Marinicellulosiphila megalodicopiae TaxID=2724896 RepID=UPI003BB0844E